MTKLFYAQPENGAPDLVSFIEALDEKLLMKLLSQFYMLMTQPVPGEPTVKHFTIEKYSKLYELRARSQVMARIVFTIRNDGSILFLAPFIKRHTRNTMQALDCSLKMLRQIHTGACQAREVPIGKLLGGVAGADGRPCENGLQQNNIMEV